MRVYWTLTPAAGFGIGLCATEEEAQDLADRHGLGRHGMAPTPICAGEPAGDLSSRLVAAGVAPQVVEAFDGTSKACAKLATALLNAGTDVGQE